MDADRAPGVLAAGRAPAPGLAIGSRGIHLALFLAIFFTSSFDLFLNFRIAGFSLRFCYLTILFLVLVNLPRLPAYLGRHGDIPGLVPLLGWTAFITAFVGNTPFLTRNIGYMIWHYIHLLFILVLVNNVNRVGTYLFLLKGYLTSFVFVAAFGLAQFFLGIAGISILIKLWWFPGLPRINGFSYEPSFFGSYLIIGWILFFVLGVSRFPALPKAPMRAGFLVITLCLLLSSSRMSVLVMALFVSVYSGWVALNAFMTLKVRPGKAVVSAFSLAAVAAGAILLVVHFDKVAYLFSGLGVGNQSSHSAEYRLQTMQETWDVFLDSPFLGVSLGGVASHIASRHGEEATSNEVVKVYEGANVFVEVLAASGIIGYLFFLWYLAELFRRPLVLLSRPGKADPGLGILLHAFLLALLFELIILSMNQNILRPFLWVHIAMLCLTYKLARNGADLARN